MSVSRTIVQQEGTRSMEGTSTSTVVINGRECLVLRLADATDEEIQAFCGDWLAYQRKEDRVLCLRNTQDPRSWEDEYVAPWREDILVKPAATPEVRPLAIAGVVPWAAELFGTAPDA